MMISEEEISLDNLDMLAERHKRLYYTNRQHADGKICQRRA